jgi:hypothetical protein
MRPTLAIVAFGRRPKSHLASVVRTGELFTAA